MAGGPETNIYIFEIRKLIFTMWAYSTSETLLLNFWGAQESISPAYVAWRAGTTTLFQIGS
jgi:hypothetical protein